MDTGIENIEEHMTNIASEFLVFKATICDPSISYSVVLAKQSCSSIHPSRLLRIFRGIVIGLAAEDIEVIIVCGDGARENVIFFDTLSTESIDSIISDTTRALFQQFDLEAMTNNNIAMIDPINNEPIFFVEDMPHIVKRIVNAMDRSSSDRQSRDMKYGDKSLNLGLIKTIWKASGGLSNELKASRLTMKHFVKDNFSRMRVYLAVQVLSNSVVELIIKVRDDEDVKLPFHKEYYNPLIQIATHVNKLVDIINGRDRADFRKESGVEIITSLLKILKWFDEWKKLNDRCKELDEKNFLPEDTWIGIKRMILGYICLIDHYCIGQGLVICPRRTLSDVCEHLFSMMRRCAGSTSMVTTNSAHSTCAKDSLMQLCRQNIHKGSNCEQGPSILDESHMRHRKSY